MTAELLSDPSHIRGDLRMMETHIRSQPIEIADAVVAAMPKVMTTLLLKGKPREQLAAGKLLLAFMEYNQSLNPKTPPQTTINVGVKVENNSDTGRNRASKVLERLRLDGVPARVSE